MDLNVKLNTNKLLSTPNIAEMLDQRDLNTIGFNVITEFNLDKEIEIFLSELENALLTDTPSAEIITFTVIDGYNIFKNKFCI